MKNSKGISLIALIITIIVIIILAAIVIGGVFNTPNDAKFANFCQEYDRVQTAIQLNYYELYQKHALDSDETQIPTHYDIYYEVATGGYADNPTHDASRWVKIDFTKVKNCDAPSGLVDWYLRTNDGKLAYAGFEKEEKEMYFTPNIHVKNTDRKPLVLANGALTEDGNAVTGLEMN